MNTKKDFIIIITGAAGNIGSSLVFLILKDESSMDFNSVFSISLHAQSLIGLIDR